MRSQRIVFIDDKLEKTFNSLDDKDPIKKALRTAIREIQEDCHCGRNVKE